MAVNRWIGDVMEASGGDFVLDVGRIPSSVTIRPSRFIGWIAAVLGVMFMSVGAGHLALAGDPALLAFPAIGFAIFLIGLSQALRRVEVRFDGRTIAVARHGPFGEKRFTEPVAAYRAVAVSAILVRSGNRNVTVHRIRLLHDDPDRCVTIWQRRRGDLPRAEWEAYAKALGLPAQQGEGATAVTRELADLDKPLRDLAREGRIAAAVPNAPPPAAIAVEAGDDAIVLTLRKPPMPWPIVAGFVLVPLVAAAGLAEQPFPAPLIGAAVATAFLGAGLYMALQRRRIVVHRDRVETSVALPVIGRVAGGSIRHGDIETITVLEERGNAVKALLIAGDAARLKTAEGLSRRELEWLRDYLTSAVATA